MLEILSCEDTQDAAIAEINRPGFAHIELEGNDVYETRKGVISNDGCSSGMVVATGYPDGARTTFIYAQVRRAKAWTRLKNFGE